MKITILQGAFLPVPPIQGGAVEKIWYKMGQEFASLGHEVLHISKAHSQLPKQEEINGVNYLRVSGYDTPSNIIKLKWLDLLYSRRAIKKISDDPDVIVTNTFWSPILLRRKIGNKVYVSVERLPKGQMKFYTHVGRLRGCSPSICEGIKEEISEKYHHLVSYIPNPVPFDIKHRPQSLEKENIILFVGRLHPEKGVHILLKAFSLLDANLKNKWKLIILGPHDTKDGGGGKAYKNQLLDLVKHDNIKFKGPIYSDYVLKKFYAKAKIFCYPAQEFSGDAAPVAPREAMSFGAVPIVSKLPCFNDFIVNNENAIVYDHKADVQEKELAESLNHLMKNSKFLKDIAYSSRQTIKKYSPKIIAKKFLEDFRNMNKSITYESL